MKQQAGANAHQWPRPSLIRPDDYASRMAGSLFAVMILTSLNSQTAGWTSRLRLSVEPLLIKLTAAVQSLLNLLTKHVPEPVKWIASSDPASEAAHTSMAMPMGVQTGLPMTPMNAAAIYSPYSGLQSPMAAASAISAPFGMPFFAPSTQTIPGIAGITMANSLAMYPLLASNDRRTSSGSFCTSPSATLVGLPDKQPFDCGYGM